MDNENYNIDDILSELKRHKETAEPPEAEEAPFTVVEEGANTEEAPATEETPEVEVANETEDIPETEETPEAEEPEGEKKSEENEAAETEAEEGTQEEVADKAPEEEDAGIDIMAIASGEAESEADEGEDEDEYVRPEREPKKKHKGLKAAIIILVILLIGAIVAAVLIVNGKLNIIRDNSKGDTNVAQEEPWTGMDKLIEDFQPIEETEATELASYFDMLKTWYYNGTPCSSTHVLNVMLIGEDTRGSNILEDGTRADSAILVSVNIDTKQVTMTSVLRDSWAYFEDKPGDETTGRFNKINSAMAFGDVYTYMNAVSNLFKVKVDKYAIVNFDSFESIVDALGGVELELEEREINEINNNPSRYGYVTIKKKFEGEKGIQRLNGEQALAYCRIRHIDTDNARADRQKTTLQAIFEQTKDASTPKLLKMLNKLVPYVQTNFKKKEIVKIATYAFSQGWLDFDIYSQNLPEMNVVGGMGDSAYNGQWVFKPDYPADAYLLQTRMYDKSSITLARVRVDIKNAPSTGFFKEGYSAMYTTYINPDYGVATTLPPETTEETQESTTIG